MSNRVKGPTSALSDFLRERGIKARNFHMLSPKAAQPRPLECASSDSDDNDNNKGRSRKKAKKEETLYDTESIKVKQEHSPEPETITTTTTIATTITARVTRSHRRRQHLTSTEQSIKDEESTTNDVKVKQEESLVSINTIIPVADIGHAMRQRRVALRKKQRGLENSEDEFELDSKPKQQQQQLTVAFCKQCRRRFTITSNCRVLPNGARLCVECSAKAGRLPDAKLNGRGRRRGINNSNKNSLGWWLPEDDPVVSLRNACIKVIGDNIHNIDSLGSLNERNMDKVCQIICKHRQLSPSALKLFLDPSRTTIQLYDCTKLDEDDLKNIAQFCPNIDTLLLWYCGRLSPETTLFYAERLIQLRSITLHGPFLVTDQVFATLLETIGKQLQRFSISHSGRLSTKTLAAIAQQCPNLKELQLSGCSAVGDMDILKLADAVVQQSITMLDLSGTVSQVSDATMIAVLRVLGPTLRKLNLTNGLMFTDKLLVEGLTPHCTNLQELVLSNCTQLTDRGMKSLFEHWIQHNVSNKKSHDDDGSGGGLKVLELAHCDQLTSTSLVMAFEYCGAKLVTLNLNSVYQIDDAVFTALSQHCSQLNCLDVSWCRTVSDAHLEELYMSCSNLLLVKIWGCNRVTEYLMPPRKDARLIGRECDTI